MGHVFHIITFLVCLGTVLSDIEIRTERYIYGEQPDLPANFGPPIPEEGIDGLLMLASPEDACSPLQPPPADFPYIMLIKRAWQARTNNCTFDVKVHFAELAGAIAAIIYDDIPEPLVPMSKPQWHADPDIPATFVTKETGEFLIEVLHASNRVHVHISPSSGLELISMFMSAFLGLLALTVVMAMFYVMRSWTNRIAGLHGWAGAEAGAAGGAPGATRPVPEGGLPPNVLRSLPIIIYEPPPPRLKADADAGDDLDCEFADAAAAAGSEASSEAEVAGLPGVHAGETKRMCAICIEVYAEGEKVRVLPCQHRFHSGCIDQWLSSRRACPVCKHDASKPLLSPDHSNPAAGGGSNEAPSPAPQTPRETLARAARWVRSMFRRPVFVAAAEAGLSQPLLRREDTSVAPAAEPPRAAAVPLPTLTRAVLPLQAMPPPVLTPLPAQPGVSGAGAAAGTAATHPFRASTWARVAAAVGSTDLPFSPPQHPSTPPLASTRSTPGPPAGSRGSGIFGSTTLPVATESQGESSNEISIIMDARGTSTARPRS